MTTRKILPRKAKEKVTYVEDTDDHSDSDSNNEVIGKCTDDEILSEIPKEYWDESCLYMILLYLPDLHLWVTKCGYTDVGIRKRLKGLATEYMVHKDRYFINSTKGVVKKEQETTDAVCVPSIIPLYLASTKVVPSVAETQMKGLMKGLAEPILRRFTRKCESGTRHSEIYDCFVDFVEGDGKAKVKNGKIKTLFESEFCLVDENFVSYRDVMIWTKDLRVAGGYGHKVN